MRNSAKVLDEKMTLNQQVALSVTHHNQVKSDLTARNGYRLDLCACCVTI